MIKSLLFLVSVSLFPSLALAENCNQYLPCGSSGSPSCADYNACNRRNEAEERSKADKTRDQRGEKSTNTDSIDDSPRGEGKAMPE